VSALPDSQLKGLQRVLRRVAGSAAMRVDFLLCHASSFIQIPDDVYYGCFVLIIPHLFPDENELTIFMMQITGGL
jgi:hypothetical protein